MELVPPSQFPKEIYDCPFVNLLEVYHKCLLMQEICVRESGIGLSAIQVGLPWRLFVVNYQDDYRFFANTKYYPMSDKQHDSLEGCLSLRQVDGRFRYFLVQRYNEIKVVGCELKTYPRLHFEQIELMPTDYIINVMQHEIDHQDNITIDIIGKEYDIWPSR